MLSRAAREHNRRSVLLAGAENETPNRDPRRPHQGKEKGRNEEPRLRPLTPIQKPPGRCGARRASSRLSRMSLRRGVPSRRAGGLTSWQQNLAWMTPMPLSRIAELGDRHGVW
jgi:hypothetical protein